MQFDSVVDQSINELEETQNEDLKEELQTLEKLEKVMTAKSKQNKALRSLKNYYQRKR